MVAGRTGIILQVVGLEVVLEHGIAAMAQDTNWWTDRPIHPQNSGFGDGPVTVVWYGDNSQPYVYRLSTHKT
jgi:hypothetical protein